MKKPTRSDIVNMRPKSLKPEPRKSEGNSIFSEFASEIQMKSIDTIVKDYKTNSFFRIKVDLFLK